MYKASQFLVELRCFFDWFDASGIFAVAIMITAVLQLRKWFVNRLSPTSTFGQFGTAIAVGGVVSISSSLFLTITALTFLPYASEFGLPVLPQFVHSAGLDDNQNSLVNPARRDTAESMPDNADRGKRLAWRSIRGEGRIGRYLRVIKLGIILLAVVGGGYAFTLFDLTFWPSFAAMSAGVGFPEELAKAAAGMLVLYAVFTPQNLPKIDFRRTVLVAFGTAGIGFGVFEALKYFGAYRAVDAGIFWYIMRATWCVTLHGAWTLIAGALLVRALPRNAGAIAHKWNNMLLQLVGVAIATAIIHGLYNAACMQGGLLPWLTGGLSIIAAAIVVGDACTEKSSFFSWPSQPA